MQVRHLPQPVQMLRHRTSQSWWYLLLVMVTILMVFVPLVMISLHPTTSLLSANAPAGSELLIHQHVVRPILIAQLGLPERWCITPGHEPHPVPSTPLHLWLTLGIAVGTFCVIHAHTSLRIAAQHMRFYLSGTPPTPPPRFLLHTN